MGELLLVITVLTLPCGAAFMISFANHALAGGNIYSASWVWKMGLTLIVIGCISFIWMFKICIQYQG